MASSASCLSPCSTRQTPVCPKTADETTTKDFTPDGHTRTSPKMIPGLSGFRHAVTYSITGWRFVDAYIECLAKQDGCAHSTVPSVFDSTIFWNSARMSAQCCDR